MDVELLTKILKGYANGSLDIDSALSELKDYPEADLGFAKLDTQRSIRVGFPEVVYCAGKSDEQLYSIIERLLTMGGPLLGTRASEAQFDAVKLLSSELHFSSTSRTIHARRPPAPPASSPYIAIVAAGTSDVPVAEEAAVTAEMFGQRVERIYDVGVAGIHRLFRRLELIRGARVVIAVAGMEGALPSVVGGLVSAPVIAVPTSIGYGASFNGLTALLAMLNSCASGISVVNIDNGFGAGYQASLINRL
ncbi:MAG: nickel pincer cofactor biosynthesis protein LarB, partial [Spirochaetia bacterium]|nr:nickel pincer cofactor biosynthesis protein LarB [Spirochaetia bacterium]